MTFQIYVIFITETLSRGNLKKCFALTCFSTNTAILSPNHTTSEKKEGLAAFKTSPRERPSISGGLTEAPHKYSP